MKTLMPPIYAGPPDSSEDVAFNVSVFFRQVEYEFLYKLPFGPSVGVAGVGYDFKIMGLDKAFCLFLLNVNKGPYKVKVFTVQISDRRKSMKTALIEGTEQQSLNHVIPVVSEGDLIAV